MDIVGQTLAERYRIEERIASGGMAEVYRAADLRLGRPVAVKLPHPHLASDPDFLQRFRREAEAAGRLNHRNVVGVYDLGEVDGRPFLVMELVQGESLAQLLRRHGRLPLDRAVEIAQDILAGLAHAHAQGIVHRDVKPQNVLLQEGRARLADFGIAQAATTDTLTGTGEVLGSLAYIAPERLDGQRATPTADLYGVGVVLYQMLTGRVPFQADTPAAAAAQRWHRLPAPPSELRPELPRWVDQVVMTALALQPERRFASAAAMHASLEQRRPLAGPLAPTLKVGADRSRIPSLGPASAAPSYSFQTSDRSTFYAAALLGLLALLALALMGGRFLWQAVSPAFESAITAIDQLEPPSVEVEPPMPPPSQPAETKPSPKQQGNPEDAADPEPAAGDEGAQDNDLLDRLLDLRRFVSSRNTSGRDGKIERDILKELKKIEEQLAEGKEKDARERVEKLAEKVEKEADKGELDAELAARLRGDLATIWHQIGMVL